MKIFSIFFAAAFLFVACKKKNDNNCIPVSADSEAAGIAAFCNAYGISYTMDSNGIYYQVIDRGSGAIASDDSVITITYTTSLLSGDVIDDHSTDPVTSPLKDFIEGWRLAIPHIQEGGHIKMVIPSSLAYGCTGIAGLVPPNSPLYSDL